MNRTLIIGGTGFAGSHMKRASPVGSNTLVVGRAVDIRNKESLKTCVKTFNPDLVVNMASITTVKEAVLKPDQIHDICVHGTTNLLASLTETNFEGTLLSISSSEVYGKAMVKDLPILESTSLRPRNPYAQAKAQAEIICTTYENNGRYKIIVARPFTHIGPGQSERFSVSSFTQQVSEIMKGLRSPFIEVGNLNTTRDFTDVRDVVRAYWLLLKYGEDRQIYNVCTGKEVLLRSVLEIIIRTSKLSIDIIDDVNRFRDHEQMRIVGCSQKLHKTTGWKPKYTLNETISDMMAYYLNQ